jgi:hypothetical protein
MIQFKPRFATANRSGPVDVMLTFIWPQAVEPGGLFAVPEYQLPARSELIDWKKASRLAEVLGRAADRPGQIPTELLQQTNASRPGYLLASSQPSTRSEAAFASLLHQRRLAALCCTAGGPLAFYPAFQAQAKDGMQPFSEAMWRLSTQQDR